MSFDFLRSYTIPTAASNDCYDSAPANGGGYEDTYSNNSTNIPELPHIPSSNLSTDPSSNYYGTGENSLQYEQNEAPYQNPNRFIPPGKQGTSYKLQPKRAHKRPYNNALGGDCATAASKFQDRFEGYPEELKVLFKPLFCELCNVQLNSPKTAFIHFESKTHDKNITSWLSRNYTDQGLEPPTIKRFYKCGPVGPDAFHCEVCDLKLTSKSHADQHYSGRKHKLVLSNISKPSGSGFYNAEGKWVRTGTKATPIVDARYGIGEQFKYESAIADSSIVVENEQIPATTTTEPRVLVAKVANTAAKLDESLQCKLCGISATSALQMTLHLEGIKHRKKLKACGEQVAEVKPTETVLASLSETMTPSDLSTYRTPSGSYYCKTCDISMAHQSALVQHLLGKKHIKKSADAAAVAVETAKKVTL